MLIQFSARSQNNERDTLFESFNSYVTIPQEVVHLHINKAIFMQEEDLGFTAYVQDKSTKKPALNSKNLYIQILNADDELVKEQLLLLDQGVATGKIVLDVTFKKGDYTIRAFTSWMKNFDRPHFYETKFKVLEPFTNLNTILEKTSITDYDIQLMPESGRAVDGVFTQVGVLVKNSLNRGVAVKADVFKNSKKIAEVSTNEMGFGRFKWLPDMEASYFIQFNVDGNSIKKPLPNIEPSGISMSVNEVNDKVYVQVKTNPKTLKQLKNNTFLLAFHGNKKMKGLEVTLEENTTLPVALDDLTPGVNQIILFDTNNRIVCERLFYKYDDSVTFKFQKTEAKIKSDSVAVALSLDPSIWNKKGTISVSVLPVKTIASTYNENIVSTLELAPYVNGLIENSQHYFNGLDRKTRYDMDNLMICQGWKIYDWDNIFNQETEFKYPFEKGIIAEIKIKNKRFDEFMVYSGRNSPSRIISETDEGTFYLLDYYPGDNEKLRISGIGDFGKAKKVKGVPRFYPSSVPTFRPKNSKTTHFKSITEKELEFSVIPFVDNSESLDTIVLNSVRKEEKRQKEIKRRAKGNLYFFNDQDRIRITSITQYLNRTMGVRAVQSQGQLTVVFTNRGGNAGLPDPVLELDDVVYYDFNVLSDINPAWIDYVEIGFSGVGGPPGSQGGFVRIKTDPLLSPNSSKRKDFTEFEVPLVFQTPLQFYTPEYFDYYGDFFNKLGVIDWKGEVNVTTDGRASFVVPYLGQKSMMLNIQGWNQDGQLISENIDIPVEQKD